MQGALPWFPLDWIVIGLALLGLGLIPAVVFLARRKPALPELPRNAELDVFRGSRRDQLTALPNRASFEEFLARRLQSSLRSAVLLIDLDHFASCNCAYGHRFGDDVLVGIASRLRQLIPDPAGLGRLGDDEFAVLLDATGGRHEVEGAALRILRSLMSPLQAGTQMTQCSVSIGVVLTPDHGTEADAILTAAQSTLQEAKAAGGGGFRIFNPERHAADQMRAVLKEELRVAIEAGQIIPYYQPIMDLRSQQIKGLEVLARWQHPTKGILSPDVFVPMAEELQLSGQITQCLMRRVVRDARDWPSSLYFALNVSPGQLRELIAILRDPPVWPEGELDPTRLEIEVTESALIEDIDVAREVIALLHARGTRVVLDDFGVGFSNMSHLRELPFDRIKIDRSFVMDSCTDPRAEACVRAMLALGTSLGIDMVAEGLETRESANHMERLGCRFGQGYLFSMPVPANGVYPMMQRLRAGADTLVA